MRDNDKTLVKHQYYPIQYTLKLSNSYFRKDKSANLKIELGLICFLCSLKNWELYCAHIQTKECMSCLKNIACDYQESVTFWQTPDKVISMRCPANLPRLVDNRHLVEALLVE